MARKLNKLEGILSGGSSGANMVGAMMAAKQLKAGQNCVVILPDGVRNYITKFMNDKWMLDKKCIDSIPEITNYYPINTFDITKVYNPEAPPDQYFQKISEPWPKTVNFK